MKFFIVIAVYLRQILDYHTISVLTTLPKNASVTERNVCARSVLKFCACLIRNRKVKLQRRIHMTLHSQFEFEPGTSRPTELGAYQKNGSHWHIILYPLRVCYQNVIFIS